MLYAIVGASEGSNHSAARGIGIVLHLGCGLVLEMWMDEINVDFLLMMRRSAARWTADLDWEHPSCADFTQQVTSHGHAILCIDFSSISNTRKGCQYWWRELKICKCFASLYIWRDKIVHQNYPKENRKNCDDFLELLHQRSSQNSFTITTPPLRIHTLCQGYGGMLIRLLYH